MHKERRKR